MTPPKPSAKIDPAHTAARAELTAAFDAFRILKWLPAPPADTPEGVGHSRDLHQARERLGAAQLYFLNAEAHLVVHRKVKVDSKLPADQRRDRQEFISNAVGSVLANPAARPTLLTQTVDEQKGDIAVFLAQRLYWKVLDHVRKEPKPGLENGGKADWETSTIKSKEKISTPLPSLSDLLPPPQQIKPEQGTLLVKPTEHDDSKEDAAEENSDSGARAPAEAEGFNPGADHEVMLKQLWEKIESLLLRDEFEVFCCDFQGMTAEEGVEALNELHGTHLSSEGQRKDYMSLATYKRRLKSAKEKLQAGLGDWVEGMIV